MSYPIPPVPPEVLEALQEHRRQMQAHDLHTVTGQYLRALRALAGVAHTAVAHLAHNASRDHATDPGYVTTCLLLMRPDAPGGQLAEALARIDRAWLLDMDELPEF